MCPPSTLGHERGGARVAGMHPLALVPGVLLPETAAPGPPRAPKRAAGGDMQPEDFETLAEALSAAEEAPRLQQKRRRTDVVGAGSVLASLDVLPPFPEFSGREASTSSEDDSDDTCSEFSKVVDPTKTVTGPRRNPRNGICGHVYGMLETLAVQLLVESMQGGDVLAQPPSAAAAAAAAAVEEGEDVQDTPGGVDGLLNPLPEAVPGP